MRPAQNDVGNNLGDNVLRCRFVRGGTRFQGGCQIEDDEGVVVALFQAVEPGERIFDELFVIRFGRLD